MRYARDDRAKKVVDAHDIGEHARHRGYTCPSCGARVHYKRSIGLSPDPIFAHNPHEGSPDCDSYYPWQAGYQVPMAATKVRPKPEVEDAPEEFGLCLEDGDTWSLYLRIPEMPASELTTPLSGLTAAFIEIDAGGQRNRLSLIELRPSVGSARLTVTPMTSPYKVTTTGAWPPGIRQQRWQAQSRGLNPRGTFFRYRCGEWVRLRDGSPG